MKFAHSPCFGEIYHLYLQGKYKSSTKPAEVFCKLFPKNMGFSPNYTAL
jgi:hypothetical protein